MGSTKTENESNTLRGSSWKRFDRCKIAHIWHDWVSSLHARNEIEGVFASNSKYVVCLKKLFAGKGGLYEFIMFYDMRA